MIDLDEMDRRHNGYGTTPDDIPALIAELRGLRSQLAESQTVRVVGGSVRDPHRELRYADHGHRGES